MKGGMKLGLPASQDTDCVREHSRVASPSQSLLGGHFLLPTVLCGSRVAGIAGPGSADRGGMLEGACVEVPVA